MASIFSTVWLHSNQLQVVMWLFNDDIYYLSEWYFGALSVEVEVPDVVAPQIDIYLYPFAHFESMR